MTGSYRKENDLIPWYVTGITAVVCTIALNIMVTLGLTEAS
ncbi:MAG: hypothetical protein WC375_01070 [Methanomassiliicoccales archaeon]|jgi:hypothetical protein